MITLNASGKHYHATVDDGDTAQLRRVLVEILPKVMERFARKNKQYGENEFELGVAGQFPEVWRKAKRLRALFWDGPRGGFTEFEGAGEVIDDLIGHLLMMKDCLAEDRHGYPKPTPPPMVEPEINWTFRDVVERPYANHPDAIRIREAKGGTETWTEPPSTTELDDDGVKRYPPEFRGRHSYIVGELVASDSGDKPPRVLMAAHGHVIRVAAVGEKRCAWRTGDPAVVPSGDVRCVGIEGHGKGTGLVMINGEALAEGYHINKELEAWAV